MGEEKTGHEGGGFNLTFALLQLGLGIVESEKEGENNEVSQHISSSMPVKSRDTEEEEAYPGKPFLNGCMVVAVVGG